MAEQPKSVTNPDLDAARSVLTRAAFISNDDLRDACRHLIDNGDWMDCERASAMLRQLDDEDVMRPIFAEPAQRLALVAEDTSMGGIEIAITLLTLIASFYVCVQLALMSWRVVEALLRVGI